MKIKRIFESKVLLFCIQILILILILYFSKYTFYIDFDPNISEERKWVIQNLGNLILYDDVTSFLFIFIMWILISLLPILIFRSIKKSYTMNLTTFFFPNFFFYVFLERYSKNYFNANFSSLLIKTIIIGIIIVIFSIGLSLILKSFKHFKKETNLEDLKLIKSEIKTICPNCGTKFNSIPEFCYNCNTKITQDNEDYFGKNK